MNFSINRLRTLCDQSLSAHDMLTMCNERVRKARHPLRMAREALARFDETAHLHQYPTKSYPPGDPDRKPALDAEGKPKPSRGRTVEPMGDHHAYRNSLVEQMETAQADLDSALAAQAAAHERYEPLCSLANRGRTYARRLLGTLPADLESY